MRHILNVIDQELEAGNGVYVHCVGGVGRTGTVIGCHLVRHGMSGDEALQEIKRLRTDMLYADFPSPSTVAQRQMIQSWKIGT